MQDSRKLLVAAGITVKDYPKTTCGTGSVGIDLGLKDKILPQAVTNSPLSKR